MVIAICVCVCAAAIAAVIRTRLQRARRRFRARLLTTCRTFCAQIPGHSVATIVPDALHRLLECATADTDAETDAAAQKILNELSRMRTAPNADAPATTGSTDFHTQANTLDEIAALVTDPAAEIYLGERDRRLAAAAARLSADIQRIRALRRNAERAEHLRDFHRALACQERADHIAGQLPEHTRDSWLPVIRPDIERLSRY